MGYLTTVTFYNDALGAIERNKDQFVDGILTAKHEADYSGKAVDVSVGCHCNAVSVQPARHADHHVIYLHKGNMVHAVGAYEKDWRELCEQNPKLADSMLKEIEYQLKEARGVLKNAKEKT